MLTPPLPPAAATISVAIEVVAFVLSSRIAWLRTSELRSWRGSDARSCASFGDESEESTVTAAATEVKLLEMVAGLVVFTTLGLVVVLGFGAGPAVARAECAMASRPMSSAKARHAGLGTPLPPLRFALAAGAAATATSRLARVARNVSWAVSRTVI